MNNRRWDYEEGHKDREDNGNRDREEQGDIEEALHCGAVLWAEPSAPGSVPGEVHGDDEEYLGWDVLADGVQPIPWIETDSGKLRERSARSAGSGTNEELERPLWPETWIDEDEKSD